MNAVYTRMNGTCVSGVYYILWLVSWEVFKDSCSVVGCFNLARRGSPEPGTAAETFTVEARRIWHFERSSRLCIADFRLSLFCMDTKLVLALRERNVGWRCSRMGCWGRYWGLRWTRLQESGEDYITKSFMLYWSPDIIRVIKSGRMWLSGHVARVGDRRGFI